MDNILDKWAAVTAARVHERDLRRRERTIAHEHTTTGMDLLAAARDDASTERFHLWMDAWEYRMREIHAEQWRAVLATRKALRDLRGLTANEAAGFADDAVPWFYRDAAYTPFSN